MLNIGYCLTQYRLIIDMINLIIQVLLTITIGEGMANMQGCNVVSEFKP